MQILEYFGDFLFKTGLTCLLCKKEVFNGENFCDSCQSQLTFLSAVNSCARCGRYSPSEYPYCLDCKQEKTEFELARSVFNFDKNIQKLILKYKNGGEVYLAKVFAEAMLPFYYKHFFRTDLIVAVPPPYKSLKQRGFDHTRLIAEIIAKQSGAELSLGNIINTGGLAQQKTLTKKERFKNAQKAFHIACKKPFENKNILIIDDVLTTGATASAVAKKIKASKASSVSVLTFASVGKK